MAKRENGTGSIVRRKLANGTKYVAYAPAVYIDEGDRLRKFQQNLGSFAKKADARAALDEYLKHPTTKYNYTLRNLYDEWSAIAFQDIAKQTKTNYTTCWAKIETCPSPKIADKPLREITTAEMRLVLDHYAASLSKSYITKLKALLTQLYDYAMENNIIDRNYASLVKLPKMETAKARAFSDLEFQKLEKNWSKTTGGDACLVLCYTGWRVTEFCELTRFSYDQKAQPIIARWYADSNGPLYPRKDGRPHTKDSFLRTVWRPCMDALGLPAALTPHSARHTCATRLSAAGVPAEDIQRIMGHADYSVTANTYINQDMTALRASTEKVG